ncbi:hypothetical protein [Algoriphagus sp.]|uniref:hypothetical protein n=1 Tax=Algoriphagus sp. TaxID=1872435 RepID=UPI00391C2D20
MKKQKIALLLSLFWLIGLAAAFSFPPHVKTGVEHSDNQSVLSELFSPELTLRVSGNNPDVPSFKPDLSFAGFIDSTVGIDWLPSHSQYHSPAFFSKSKPLFDVLITFLHFFYTW